MNNDRFKFRVWDKSNAKYGSSFAIESNGAIWHNGCYVLQSNYIIEQCTGLRDKNGKLIYEGDWVRCYLNGNPFGTYLVKFDERSGSLYYFAGDQEASQSLEDFDEVEVEVVGNIHEVKK